MPLPGAHPRVHVWPDVWPTESHEPWMAMKRVLGPQQGATRCSQSIRKWPSPLFLPRLVHGKLPSSLAPLPRSFPPPWAAQSGQSPAQCEFQTARPASQCPVPAGPGAHLIIRSQLGAGPSRLRWAGRLEHTHSSFNCHLQPPQSDIFDAFHPSATGCTHVAATHPHRNLPTTVAAARSSPLHGHHSAASTDTPGLAAGLVRASGRAGGPREHSLNSPASSPLSRTKSSLSAI